MDNIQWIIFAAVVLVIVIYVYIRNRKQARQSVEDKISAEWGRAPVRKSSQEEYENISHYFRNTAGKQNTIDDITWNDIGMDDIFCLINNTYSSVGQEYLYKCLRTLNYSQDKLLELNKLSDLFASDEKLRKAFQRAYIKLGYAKKISVSDYMQAITELEAGSNMPHYMCLLAIIASVAVLFFNSSVGILCIIASIGYSIIAYYSYKARVEPYFICVSHIVRMAECAKDICRAGRENSVIRPYAEELDNIVRELNQFIKNSSVLGASTGLDGSLASIIMDYVRMLTHVDLIKFNSMIRQIGSKKQYTDRLFEILGMLETSIATASFRAYLDSSYKAGWCRPKLTASEPFIKANNLYHPLIEKPVANSIDENRCVLLTGSNASGKSTFLKTVAVNAVLAQTIFTCAAEEYSSCYYRIYSSMALKDDLSKSESYYMAEIKALKRIMQAIVDDGGSGDVPVMCFIDEVLRGTNTIERIAASSQILYEIASSRTMCFAATHDIELTEILEDVCSNYHFQEEVLENDISFNYKLYKGRAVSRNAIRLLSIMGYAPSIVENAEQMAAGFSESGRWARIRDRI